MLPLNKKVPKEMLPVGSKPMIQHVLEEALVAGLKQICIVIREGKEVIKDYFCLRRAETDKHHQSLDQRDELVAACELSFVYQTEPLGLGDSLLQARDFVADEPFVMMVPDKLMLANAPPTLQLIRSWQDGSSIMSSLVRLSKNDVSFFIAASAEIEEDENHDRFVIKRIQTEAKTRAAYRDSAYELRGFGRTVYPPAIFDYLGPDLINPHTREVDLWKTFQACSGKIAHLGVMLEGEPCDLGTPAGYYHYAPRFQELRH